MAPRKMRLIASTLKGLPISEAEAQLLFRAQRAAKPILKLLRSAVANAKNNAKLDVNKLFIENIKVDQGPILKRSLPRAMGRTTPIQKKMSHVTIILQEAETASLPRFTINPPLKKEKKSKKETVKKAKMKEEKVAVKKPEKAGFFKRIFRRKTV